jgi:Zn-dependent protease
MNWSNILQRLLYTLPGVIIGLTCHEFMHAFTAYKLGDPTAKEQNRLSLNPLRHIDPVGFVFLLIAGFGWAKPVMINRGFLRKPRRDEVLISLSGPAANLVLALLLSVLFRLLAFVVPMPIEETGGLNVFWSIFYSTILINYGLFIFNLIPIPPLDGSHLIFAAVKVSPSTEAKIYRYGSLGFFGLLVLSLFLDRVAGFGLFDWLGVVIRWMAMGFLHLLGM